MVIEIYADGADLATMGRLADDPAIYGFTTNPALLKKAGITDYRGFAQAVLAVTKGKPVSFEVLSDDFEEMIHQGRVIDSWGPNVYVKVPISDSKGVFSGPVISSLSALGVKLNITAVLTHQQADKALGVLNGKGHIVSVFAGRIADTGRNPHHTVSAITITAHRTGNRVLWASAREVLNAVQAEELSCDIITLTPELIAKLDGFGRDLDECSMATVRQFHEDARGITLSLGDENV